LKKEKINITIKPIKTVITCLKKIPAYTIVSVAEVSMPEIERSRTKKISGVE